MSRYVRPMFDAERDYGCTFCGAEPGHRCRRKMDGKIASEPHMSRTHQWFEAGLKDGSIRQFEVRIVP